MRRRRTTERLADLDWHVLAVALVLTGIGLTFIWSATHNQDSGGTVVARQILYVGVSLPLMAALIRVPYPAFARWAPAVYGVLSVVLVLLLLRGGGSVRNTASYVRLPFGFGLQPSEFAKVAVIMMLATYLRFRPAPNRFRAMWGPLALVGFPFLLVAKQPDLGTAVVLIPILFAMLYAAGCSAWRLVLFVVIGIGLGVAFYASPFIHDYQKKRIDNFFVSIPELTAQVKDLRSHGQHREANEIETQLRSMKQDQNLQAYHAQISIGSGGTFGKGIGKGPHNQLDFLPERHNDFIFAVIGEEWGFVGSTLVLLLALLLVALILGVAARTRDAFGRLLCVGIATMFGFQTFVNTGVATGLLPITGLTLPFLSSGGSSLMASFLALAIVLNVGANKVTALDGETFGHNVFGEVSPKSRSR